MEYKSLGRTGVQVSNACLGTWTFGADKEGWGPNQEVSHKIIDECLELGINFVDTADVYTRGASETIIGNYFTPEKRKKIILATKCYWKMDDEDPNAWGNTRRHIIESCENSLKRLKTDWIDLFQIHRPQPSIPIDETLRALDDLIRSGKVRYAGSSCYAGWQACEAHYVAKQLGINGYCTEQPPYNLLERRIERELLPFCRTYNYGVIPWSPLAFGQLTGKYLGNKKADGRINNGFNDFNDINPDRSEIISKLKEIACANDMSLIQLSIAWVANQPGITCPILGFSKPQQVKEPVAACNIKLSDDILAEIDKVVPPCSNHVNYYRSDFGPNARPNV